MAIAKQNEIAIWYQPEGEGTAFKVLGIGEAAGSMTGQSLPGSDRTPVYGRDRFGNPIVIAMNEEAPGDLPTATISVYERGTIDFLLDALRRGCPINVQRRIVTCGNLGNPANWDVIDFWGGGQVTEYTPGDGPSLEFSGEAVANEASLSFLHVTRIVRMVLSALTTGETLDFLSIGGLTDETCNECNVGYPGADKVLYAGTAGDGAAEATLYYSVNGGSSWAATSATPFVSTASDFEDLDSLEVRFISQDTIRIIVATSTSVAGTEAQYAVADVILGDEGTTVWVEKIIAATSAGDTVTALGWPVYDRVYLASAGDIYVSNDQGDTVEATPLFTGSTQINGFAGSPDESEVWAFGESNLILREAGQDGVFATRVGPSGGGAFHSVSVAGNGNVYAGNGTAIFVSKNKAVNAGGWTQLRDFGTNKAVVEIHLLGGDRAGGGDSQLIRAIVNDTAGGDGEVWHSFDGGATWERVAVLTNTGYNAAYFSVVDDMLAVIAGNGGTIHRLARA